MLKTIGSNKLLKSILIAGVIISVAGCSQNPAVISTEVPIAPTPLSTISKETPIMNEVPIPTPLDSGLDSFVTQAKDDLAKRLAIAPEQIELLEASSVTWPDGSLGCPQPGMLYTQVQVDGILIRLRVDQKTYEYHGGGRRPPFLCE